MGWREVQARPAHWRYVVRLIISAFAVFIALPPGAVSFSQQSAVQQALDAYRHRDLEKARAVLEVNLKSLPNDAASHELLAIILDEQGQRPAARSHFEAALRLSPGNSTYRSNLVSFYLKSDLISEAHAQIAPLVGPAADADVDEMLGYIHLKERQEKEAVADFRAALRLNPDRLESWYWLGFTDQSLGEFHDAIASYEQALHINPQHFRALLQMGKIDLTEGAWPQAVDHLTAAAKIRPSYAATYRYLSEAQLSLGRYDLARSSAERAVQLDPADARAHYRLGLALARLDEDQKAASEFEVVNRLRATSPQNLQHTDNEATYQER